MKISLYFDVWPGIKPELVYASGTPGVVGVGTTRYRVDVEIPDPFRPELVIKGEAEEVIK